MKVLLRIEEVLNKVEGVVLILLLSSMILLSFLQVILRNVFSEGILWADILLRHMVLWIGFLGAAIAASQRRHISIDAFTRFLSGRKKAVVHVVTNLFAVIICFLLFSAAKTFLGYEIEDGGILILGIPEWYSQLIIPIGFGLLTLHFALRLAVGVRDVVKGPVES
ncbi:MAG: TRAP transporter small permease [Bacteroidota bacterium]